LLTLVKNAEVFAPEALGRRHVLVGGGRVLWLGDSEPELPGSFPIEVLDLDGLRLIPGLIDCHVHLTGGGGEGGFKTRVPPVALGAFTRGGTTSVVGTLGTDAVTRDMASLVGAARALVQEGLSAWCFTGGYHIPPATLTESVRTDVAHIDRILGVGEIAISDHRSSQPTLDELLRIASDAYVGGMVAGKAGLTHLHVGNGERGLSPVREALDRSELPARIFHPTHVNRRRALLEEAFELVDRGCTIDVTAFLPKKDSPGWSGAEAVKQYLDRDLPPDRLTVSSDGGGSLPRFAADGTYEGMGVAQPAALGETLRELVTGGAGLERVLPAFTSNVAAVLRLASKGSIRVGADADLVVLDENTTPRDVMARGIWHVRDGVVRVRGTFEDPHSGRDAK
jgi:beta-aspartyl-dipeptidase (metallo-type)